MNDEWTGDVMWDGLSIFAKKLRDRGYTVELIRSEDESFENYIMTITKDKTDKGNYFV